MTAMDPTAWFVNTVPAPDASQRVYAFPHAGGGCSSFTGLARQLGGRLQVRTLNLPGRQARFAEPPRTDLYPLVDDITTALAAEDDGRPFILLGYCFGAYLAYLVTRALEERGAARPRRLVVVGSPPLDEPRPRIDVATAGTSAFWSALIGLGGVPEQVTAHEELRVALEPALRADIALIQELRPQDVGRVATPITAMGGTHDPDVEAHGLEGWARLSHGDFRVRTVTGGHWVLEEALDEFAAAVEQEATACP